MCGTGWLPWPPGHQAARLCAPRARGSTGVAIPVDFLVGAGIEGHGKTLLRELVYWLCAAAPLFREHLKPEQLSGLLFVTLVLRSLGGHPAGFVEMPGREKPGLE